MTGADKTGHALSVVSRVQLALAIVKETESISAPPIRGPFGGRFPRQTSVSMLEDSGTDARTLYENLTS